MVNKFKTIIILLTLLSVKAESIDIDESNNCFFENHGEKYINPNIVEIERILNFKFLENSESNIKETLKLIKHSCEKRSEKYTKFPRTATTDTYDIRAKLEEVKRTCTANYSLPLPIFKSEREELLSQMNRYEEDFVLADVKYENGSYSTHSNTPIPQIEMENIIKCNPKILIEGRPFFYTIRQASLEGPCQIEKEVPVAPVICQNDISKRPSLRLSCIMRIDTITSYINDISTAIMTVKDNNNDIRPERSVILATFAVTGIISLLAFDIINTVSHQKLYRKSEDAMRNSNRTFDIADDIYSLWRTQEWAQKLNERAKIVDEELTFIAETANYYEYATKIYSKTEMKMRSTITDINECAGNNHISMLSITEKEKTSINKKAKSIRGQKYPEHKGLCSTIYKNGITLKFSFPIKDNNKKAKLLKITCIPKFEYYGKMKPKSYPQYVAIQINDSGYYELSDIQFDKCIDSNICQGAYPKYTNLKGCGIGNYVRREDSCEYESSDDNSPFIIYTGDKVYSYALIGTRLFETCGTSEKKRSHTTEIRTKLNKTCTYEIGEYLSYDPANTYNAESNNIQSTDFPFPKHKDSFYLPPPSKFTSKYSKLNFSVDTKTIAIVFLSTVLTISILAYHFKFKSKSKK